MFSFGKWTENKDGSVICNQAKDNISKFQSVELNKILDVLDALSVHWSEKSTQESAMGTISDVFSEDMNRFMLSMMSEILSRKSIEKRLRFDFKNLSQLDRFEEGLKYQSLGILLHITAGNVPLGFVDSIVMGLITKNVSLVKISSNNKAFAEFFLKTLEEIDTNKTLLPFLGVYEWKGGEGEFEEVLLQNADGVIAWGGEEMALSLKKRLSSATRLIEHGPKISFQVLTKNFLDTVGLEKTCRLIAQDICLWDQQACSNAQALYIEDTIDINLLIPKVGKALDSYHMKGSTVSNDEEVERVKEHAKSELSEFKTGIVSYKTDNSLVTFEDHPYLRPSVLNRSLVVKKFSSVDDIYTGVSSLKYYLQTCGIGASESEYHKLRDKLAGAGVLRLTSLGKMLNGKDGSPHDGRLSLLELTNVISEEFELEPNFESPLTDGSSFSEENLKRTLDVEEKGIVFGSGGTTGNPKYIFYRTNEFRQVTNMLANSYRDLGLGKGDRVLNLFMAGNLWSSFSAIQYALDEVDVVQFPLGGSADLETIKNLIEKFAINTVFGIPSTILQLSDSLNSINKVFYAGEGLTTKSFEYLRSMGVQDIYSAGYAAVDVGPIGYQTKDCKLNEHYLFEDLISLEVIDNEAIVSSKVREAMPVQRYKTGDRVKLLTSEVGVKFRLEGRVDELIFIWSSRIKLKEVEQALGVDDFQIVLNSKEDLARVDILEIRTSEQVDLEVFTQKLWSICADLRETQSLKDIQQRIKITQTDFLLNERTGKKSTFIDLR